MIEIQKSSFFNAEIVNGEYDRVYLAEDYARYFSSFIGNGVFPNPSDNLKVIAEGGSMKVTVKAGKAWINGYYYENDSDLTLLIENADGVLNRIDRVVLRLDLLEREISIHIKKGTYSSNASAEDVERNSDIYELAIADIKISNGVISLNNSNITDLRLNRELCGIVCGTIDEVDTTDIFNTYQYYLDEKINSDEFNEWFIGLKNRLNPNEDAAFQLQIQIDELEKKLGDSLKTDGTVQENLNADMIDGKQADGELITNEKENLVKAINEVFTYASNGKEKIAKALTGLLNTTISDTSTFQMLADKISNIAKLNAKTYLPNTSNQIINKNQYINEVQTIKGDANLVPANIIQGKSIFGVNGTVTTHSLLGRRVIYGTYTHPSGGNAISLYVGFNPTYACIQPTWWPYSWNMSASKVLWEVRSSSNAIKRGAFNASKLSIDIDDWTASGTYDYIFIE